MLSPAKMSYSGGQCRNIGRNLRMRKSASSRVYRFLPSIAFAKLFFVALGMLMIVAARAQEPLVNLGRLPYITDAETFAITAENPTGEKGKGGAASGALGAGRKGRPSIKVPPGKPVVLADIQGTGCIKHIWITVPPPGKEYKTGPNLWRDLVIRMYWDGSKTPCVEAPLGDFFGLGQ